jgi:hypothetical protein
MSGSQPADIERLRAALARLADDPTWPDADTERIFSALHGEMSAEERRAVVDELVGNPQAAAAWRLAREIEPERPASVPAHGRPWIWLSVAATLAIVAGAVWQFQPWRSDPPVYRSAETRSIASRLTPGQRVLRADPVLRWTPVEQARYRVRIMTPGLDLLAEVDDLSVAEYRLTTDILNRTPAGGRILWQVEARVSGTATVVSPTFSIDVE